MDESKTSVDRRRFLQAGAAAAALGGAALAGGRPASSPGSPTSRPPVPRPARAPRPRARNVIFLVSDGMSAGTLTMADMLSRRRHGRGSAWVELWSRPGVRRASASTFSADSLVTDSAAGGSAWGIGEHVNNGSVNITPDGRRPTPLLVHSRQNGKAIGLVTTTRLTHATPASFIANVPGREQEDEIARQMLARGLDVGMGGGARHFPQALLDAHPGVRVVRDREAVRALSRAAHPPGGPIIGLFAQSHMSYELDRGGAEPTLSEMTAAALSILDARSDGFVLQVEGGRVDHAAHDNDIGSLLADQIAFDLAIGTALAYADRRGDTLVVVTSDHGNANPGLFLSGREGAERFARIGSVRRSFEWMAAQLAKAGAEGPADAGASRLTEVVKEATGVTLSEREGRILAEGARGEYAGPCDARNGLSSVLGAVLANHFGVAFMSPHHTSDFVEVTAVGPGSEELKPMIDNIELWGLVVRAMDLAPAREMGE